MATTRHRDADHVLRGGLRRAPLARSRALQHRRGRLRQAPARQAGDGLGGLPRRRAPGELGRAAVALRPRGERPARPRGRARRPGRGGAPATPETAAVFFGTWKLGAILLSMSVLYGDEGIRHRIRTPRPSCIVCSTPTRPSACPATWSRTCWCSTTSCSPAPTTSSRRVDTAADDPAQLYYSSGTTGLAKGILHAHRYILAHEEFVYCHDVRDGELFHGMGEWAWAAGIAPLLGPWRLGATQFVFQREGGFDPEQQLDVLVQARGHERVHDADRDAGDDGHRATPASATRRSSASSARPASRSTRGDPLVPRAVRAHGARLLRADRVLSAVRELPVHGGARGLDGQADARLGRADPRRGRAAGGPGRARRDLPARAVEPALPARLLEQPGGSRGDLRRRVVPHQGRGRSRTRTATSGTPAAPTT